jgi:hypothetical protein
VAVQIVKFDPFLLRFQIHSSDVSKPWQFRIIVTQSRMSNPNLVPVESSKRRRQSASPPRNTSPPPRWTTNESSRPEQPKEQPNYVPSGLLAQAQRKTSTGAILKYAAPLESRKPTSPFRFMVFKGEDQVDTSILDCEMHLVGRDRDVCHIVCTF